MHYCWTHNTCSSIAKTHPDALSHYWASRQTRATRQLFVQKNTVQLLLAMCQIIIGHAFICTRCTGPSVQSGCVAAQLWQTRFHSGCSLICCTDMLTGSLPWVSWSSLDFGSLETVVEVSKPCHNSQTNPNLIQKSSQIKFKKLLLYTYFELFSTYFSAIAQKQRGKTDRHKHTTTTVCLWGSAYQGITTHG